MIDPSTLTEADLGRQVRYEREYCKTEYGVLSSWNAKTVFVRFKGPNGEGCEPEDVSFVFEGPNTKEELDRWQTQ